MAAQADFTADNLFFALCRLQAQRPLFGHPCHDALFQRLSVEQQADVLPVVAVGLRIVGKKGGKAVFGKTRQHIGQLFC